MRILSTTIADINSFEAVQDVPSSVSYENKARIILATRFVKLVQSAIQLNVNQPRKMKEAQHDKTSFKDGPILTKSVEECAYAKMIEDFIMKYAFHDTANIYLMKIVPTLLHSGFISPKIQQAITKSLEDFISNSAEESKDGSDEKRNVFTDEQIAFLRDHCMSAIKAKAVGAKDSGKLVFAFKNEAGEVKDEERKGEEGQVNSMEVDRVTDSVETGEVMINATKDTDAMIGAMGKKRKKPLTGDVEMQDENPDEERGK
jgi:hypothetical protein